MWLDSEILIRLGIAALYGMIMGLEREMKRKPVGLKTYIVISVTSALLTIVSIESANIFSKAYSMSMDGMRLSAQIISGIGFLGAGVILRRNNDSISGLTTAAMIWGASGLGIAIGAGFMREATIGLILIMISVEVLPFLIKIIGPKSLRVKDIKLRLLVADDHRVPEVIKKIKELDLKIKTVHIKDLDVGHNIDLLIIVNEKRMTTDVYCQVKKIAYIQTVEIENLYKN